MGATHELTEKILLYSQSTTFHALYATMNLPWWYTWSSMGFAVVGIMVGMCGDPNYYTATIFVCVSITSYTADVIYIGVGGYNNLIDTFFVGFTIFSLGYIYILSSPITLPIGLIWPGYHFFRGQSLDTVTPDKLKHHSLWHWGVQILGLYIVCGERSFKPVTIIMYLGSVLLCECTFNKRPDGFFYIWIFAILYFILHSYDMFQDYL